MDNSNLMRVVVEEHGYIAHYVEGRLHNEEGPALSVNGENQWWINGKRHRADGPAIEYRNGFKDWWLNGKRHREDGPAIEYANNLQWWLNGNYYGSNDDFNNKTWKKFVKTLIFS